MRRQAKIVKPDITDEEMGVILKSEEGRKPSKSCMSLGAFVMLCQVA
jgi:t-SNARE complex subunit (syntaxin)